MGTIHPRGKKKEKNWYQAQWERAIAQGSHFRRKKVVALQRLMKGQVQGWAGLPGNGLFPAMQVGKNPDPSTLTSTSTKTVKRRTRKEGKKVSTKEKGGVTLQCLGLIRGPKGPWRRGGRCKNAKKRTRRAPPRASERPVLESTKKKGVNFSNYPVTHRARV